MVPAMVSYALPIADYMTAPVEAISRNASIHEAYAVMARRLVSSLPVLADDGGLAGVLSRSDLLRLGRYRPEKSGRAEALVTFPEQKVHEVMTPDVVTLGATDVIADACKAMVDRHIHRVYVHDDGGGVMGVLSTRDVMVAIRDKRHATPLSELMSSPVFTIRHNEPVAMATERLEKARITGLVVVEDEWPVGVFTQREALQARELAPDAPVEDAMGFAMVCMPHDARLHRAAAQASAMRVRRIIAVRNGKVAGILSGLDFARAAAS
jgi:predicted transcriptional regulator